MSAGVRDRVMEIRDPQDGTLVGTVRQWLPADVDGCLVAADAARAAARDLPTHERMRVLGATADIVAAEGEAFARLIAAEGIKTIREARREVGRCVQTLRLSAEEARRLGGEPLRFDQAPAGAGRVGYVTREPVGVVLAITPFNDPLNLVAHKVGPAVAAGNVTVVKPHEQTPLTALALREAFLRAGLPPELLHVVTGDAAVFGDALVADPRVRMVSFTGGHATGERIARLAGLKRVAMELGGNAPTIVMADADLDAAVPACVSGAFWAAGQNCLHVQRLLVQDGAFEAFVDRFVAAAAVLRWGDKRDEATDLGPLVSVEAARRVEALVADTLRRGARLLTGGTRHGAFVEPTVLADVPDDCAVAREEVFGPVSVVRRVRDLDEAVVVANAVDYGLQAAIFTRDLATAFAAVRRLDAGAVLVNDSSDFRIDAMPFGGTKGSGIGREGVREAVLSMTEPKVVCLTP